MQRLSLNLIVMEGKEVGLHFLVWEARVMKTIMAGNHLRNGGGCLFITVVVGLGLIHWNIFRNSQNRLFFC